MQQEGGRVVCKKLASQSEQLIDDYAHFLSLSLVHGQVPLTALTILAHWLSSHHSSTMVWRQRHNNVSASGRRGRDRCQSIWRKIHSRRCCFPFDSWSENTTKSTTFGHYYRGSLLTRTMRFCCTNCLCTCSLLSDLSNLANQDLNKQNGNLQKQTFKSEYIGCGQLKRK